MSVDDVVNEISLYFEREHGTRPAQRDELAIRQAILRDRRRDDRNDDEWVMRFEFQRIGRDIPELKVPEGYYLAGYLDYGGNIMPDRKYGVYPHFVHKGSQVTI